MDTPLGIFDFIMPKGEFSAIFITSEFPAGKRLNINSI